MGTIAVDYNRQHSVNRRKSPAIAGDHAEAYCRVLSTWPSLMVGTDEGDLPNLFSLNKGDLSLIFIQRHRLNYFNHTHAHARVHANTRAASTRTRARKYAHTRAQARAHARASTRTCARKQARARTRTHTRARAYACLRVLACARVCACLRVCARLRVCSANHQARPSGHNPTIRFGMIAGDFRRLAECC